MYVYVAAFLAAVALGFGGGWQTRGWKAGADDNDRAKVAAANAKKSAMQVDRGAEAFEALKRSARTRDVIVEKEVIREIQDPANAVACLNPVSMRILAGDIDASNARRGIAPEMPSASAPG